MRVFEGEGISVDMRAIICHHMIEYKVYIQIQNGPKGALAMPKEKML